MGVYVCFDDSDSNPTYSPVSSAYLVEGDSSSDENPCSLRNSKRTVSICPDNLLELEEFAAIMGWSLTIDENGNGILNTHLNK